MTSHAGRYEWQARWCMPELSPRSDALHPPVTAA
jgi:hypothetical protein